MLYDNKIYKIQNITNIHVGSGDTNFGIVDNLVQRDVLTNYPVIHSSSLKGAIREFFEFYKNDDEFIRHIFGDEDKNPGNVVFTEANLLGIPFRSRDYPYVFCMSDESIKTLVDKMESLNIDNELSSKLKKYINLTEVKSNVNTVIEDMEVKKNDELKDLVEFTGEENIAVFPHSEFKKLLEDLPVVARNQLENGKSVNLFYEEFVPRRSQFFTIISFPKLERVSKNKKFNDKEKIGKFYEEFQNMLTSETDLVQIGANATIGYGLCKFKEVK